MKSYNRTIRYYSENILPRDFFQWLLLFFVIGLMTLGNISGLSKIVVIYGFALSFLFLIYFLHHRLIPQPEVIIYFAWVAWSLTGLNNVVDRDLYFGGLRTIVQMAVMILVIAGITARQGNMSVAIFAIIIGGMIAAITTLSTGEFRQAIEVEEKTRIAGLTENANSFAYLMTFVIVGVFYFWVNKSSRWWRIFLLILISIAFIGIIFSGSRKGFLGVLVFVFFWWVFCQRRKLSKTPIKAYIIVLLLLGGIYFITDYIISSTVLGKRFEYADMARGSNTRLQMYKDGVNMIKNNPFVGVGLDNYRVLSTSGLYSHSDYIEVAANTGIIGFILYFSIYVILWRRLNHIKAITNGTQILYIVGLLKAAIIMILIVAFGRPNIGSKLTWIFLASAIGYSWTIERILMKLRLQVKAMGGETEQGMLMRND